VEFLHVRARARFFVLLFGEAKNPSPVGGDRRMLALAMGLIFKKISADFNYFSA
jgi:hypothetical protein